ncbi:unnamed protein product [Linum trigynum]|uniref:Uncharacterized protein n=1 Tax=Linum trigynum TaxID=586398 RepID=A0AAV2G5V9_9ROSI
MVLAISPERASTTSAIQISPYDLRLCNLGFFGFSCQASASTIIDFFDSPPSSTATASASVLFFVSPPPSTAIAWQGPCSSFLLCVDYLPHRPPSSLFHLAGIV